MVLKRLLQYETPVGKIPFREWLFSRKLDHHIRDRILVQLDKLSLGNPGDCKSVGGGVRELRLHFGAGYRVYFGQRGEDLVILLCGGDKASQKKDIQLAQAYWADYVRRAGA